MTKGRIKDFTKTACRARATKRRQALICSASKRQKITNSSITTSPTIPLTITKFMQTQADYVKVGLRSRRMTCLFFNFNSLANADCLSLFRFEKRHVELLSKVVALPTSQTSPRKTGTLSVSSRLYFATSSAWSMDLKWDSEYKIRSKGLLNPLLCVDAFFSHPKSLVDGIELLASAGGLLCPIWILHTISALSL